MNGGIRLAATNSQSLSGHSGPFIVTLIRHTSRAKVRLNKPLSLIVSFGLLCFVPSTSLSLSANRTPSQHASTLDFAQLTATLNIKDTLTVKINLTAKNTLTTETAITTKTTLIAESALITEPRLITKAL